MWLQVVRYYMAILILFGVPVGLLMWLVIHPFHKLLRVSRPTTVAAWR
jgi:hypothetical protein